MILKTVHVKNFKCVKDSNEFRIDPCVTALVGKNESGKTALLQALYRLNPVEGEQACFIDLDYPRVHLDEYERRRNSDPPEALITTWELEDDDREALQTVIGPVAKKFNTIAIFKDYSNEITYDFEVDEARVVAHLAEQFELLDDERSMLSGARTVIELAGALSQVEDPSQRQKRLQEHISQVFGEGSTDDAVMELLASRLPRIVYFSQYMRLPGEVSLIDLKNRTQQNALEEGHRVFLALLDMVGETADTLEQIDQFERLLAKLEGVSNRLTREIFQYWSQNRYLRVQFRFDSARAGDPPPFNDGYVLRTRIENTRHGVSTLFDDRSAGFVWFFSFLVWFNQVRKNYGENILLLLDEPGLSLHAKAQADLLRYIEERLAPDYQVIYTTHSPFMIDPANLLRARTVEDVFLEPKPGEPVPAEADLGTKVGDDVLSTDRDTVFPLQACLGYEITQTLFVGEHTLLVEGPSDILYIQWFQRKLTALGKPSLDKRWTIVPCGGIDKVAAFLSLFAGNRLHVAVLTDLAQGQKNKIRDLRESQLLRDGHVLTADMYAGKPEADVEDILGDVTYIDLVNKCYALPDAKKLKIPSDGDPLRHTRIVPRVGDHFRTLPSSVKEYDHYRPAEFLTQQGLGVELDGLSECLDRFEKLFADLNALLQ